MKREFLKNFGVLSDEQIDQIMAENGKDIKVQQDIVATKETAIQTLTTERDGLKEQSQTLRDSIKQLEEKTKGNEDLTAKLQELQTKYDTDTAALSTKLDQQARDHACDTLFAGIEFTSDFAKKAAIREFMDGNPEFKDGKFVGADDIIKKMRETAPDAFKQDNNHEPPRFTNPHGQAHGGEKNPFSFNFTSVRKQAGTEK